MIRQCFPKPSGKQCLIIGVICLGIGTFAPKQDFIRQKSFGCLTKDIFYQTVFCLHFPGDIENIIYQGAVGKGNPGLQSGIHTGAVHAVQECLHKETDVQIPYTAAVCLRLVLTGENINLADGPVIDLRNIVFHPQLFHKRRGEQNFSRFQGGSPGKRTRA